MKTEERKMLTTEELAPRWKMHPMSLANWRVQGKGPKFKKIGNKVFYDLKDVETWEQEQTKGSTVDPGDDK